MCRLEAVMVNVFERAFSIHSARSKKNEIGCRLQTISIVLVNGASRNAPARISALECWHVWR